MSARCYALGRRQETGAGMVETIVGILIGMLVILVVYNMLAVSEGYKRSTTGAADAQITGLLSQLLTGRDLANSGNGISASAADLINCVNNEAGGADTTLRPIPLVITDGGAANVSDSFISWQSASPHVVWPVDIRPPDPAAGANLVVQSPNGFSKPDGNPIPTAGTPYWVIAMANNGTGRCKLFQVTTATVPDAVSGETTLTQGAIQTTIGYTGVPANSAGTGSRLLNLGPVGDATRVRYDVDDDPLNAARTFQLRTTDCMNRDWNCALGTRNPIAQNIVLMKIQYGIDTSAPLDGTVDCWTPAIDGSGCGGNWANTTVQNPAFTQLQIDRMIAVRIAVVVRSDEPDLKDTTLVAASRAPVVLFNCAANTNAGCPNRITLGAGAAAAFGGSICAPNVICDQWRYRTYETIVPLRNTIFLATVPGGP